MLGVRLFAHAFTMLFHDFRATLRLMLFPLLIGVMLVAGVFIALVGSNPFGVAENISRQPEALAGLILPSIITMFVMTFVFCWSAVGWHRYVLLQEGPDAFLPKLNLPFLGAYFWAAFKVVLLLMLLLFPLLFLFPLLVSLTGLGQTANLPSAGLGTEQTAIMIVVGTIVGAVFSAIFFRFSLIVPAAAVGKPITLGVSWKATTGYFWAFVVIAVAVNILGYLASMIGADGFVRLALSLLLNLLNFAIGISILTTIYGTCIEKRELA